MMTPLATLEKQGGERFAREFEILFSQIDFTSMASYYTADAQLMVEEREISRGDRRSRSSGRLRCR